jgi:hypothetical protein
MAVDEMVHAALSSRIREGRRDLYGESGGPALAEALARVSYLRAITACKLKSRHDLGRRPCIP